MSQITITLLILALSMVFFVWNFLPAAIVAIGASLALYFAGILTMRELFSGFGDPVVVLIGSLLAIGAGLEKTGVGTWAGQLLIRHAGSSYTRLIIAIMIFAAVFSGVIGMNGAVAAMIPITAIIAIRTGIAPSKLMIPLAFACLTGSKLTLLGTPVNVIAATEVGEAGLGSIRFFEWSVVGLPLVAGTIAIVLLFGRALLPERRSQTIPADFSAHASTLVEQYKIEGGLHQFRVRSTSPFVGEPRSSITLKEYTKINLVGFLEVDGKTPLQRPSISEGDLLLVRGDPEAIGQFASDMHLAIRETDETPDSISTTLFNRDSGLAEVVIPPRSGLIGQTLFPGMTGEDGDLMILAIQRGGSDLGETQLVAGDHVLLRGTWEALDKHLKDPQMLVVDSLETIRQQALALGPGSREAIAILFVLILLLAFDVVPAPIAALVCAGAMLVTRVLTLPQFYKGIDWNTCIVIGAMIPLATAMTHTGAAALIGDQVIQLLGGMGPRAVLAGLFLVTTFVSQFISNTSAALVMIPIGIATASELRISALPLVIGIALGASASFLNPVSTAVNLMVHGPGGYRFGDYWKLGLIVTLWSLIVAVFIAPLYWKF